MTHQSDAAGLNVATPLSSSPSRPAISSVSSAQFRMARAALKKNISEVSKATGCAIKTISLLENDGTISMKNVGVIRRFYEDRGIQFAADAYYHSVRAPK